MEFKFNFASFSLILSLTAIFMIAGLYLWIVLGFDVAINQLQKVELQNNVLNRIALQLQSEVLQNQKIAMIGLHTLDTIEHQLEVNSNSTNNTNATHG